MTDLKIIKKKFLRSITDYRLLSMLDEEIDSELLNYYETASSMFFRCKKDLTVVDNYIQSDLTPYEIEILVSLMLVEHIKPQLLSSENLKQSLSDKDFKIYSQANQLREIRLLMENLESKSQRMITQYTWLNREKENENDW